MLFFGGHNFNTFLVEFILVKICGFKCTKTFKEIAAVFVLKKEVVYLIGAITISSLSSFFTALNMAMQQIMCTGCVYVICDFNN